MTDRTESSTAGSQQGANAGAAAESIAKQGAATNDNPQDGRDSGQSGEARPRGKTEDPDTTL